MELLYEDNGSIREEVGYIIILFFLIFSYFIGDYAINNNWDIETYKKLVMFNEALEIFPVLLKMSVGAWIAGPYIITLFIIKFIFKRN